jgi:diguanylate cyclase (GGDEF)-like protein
LAEAVEILKQNLAIEPDLQSFIDFVLKSVNKLGGNAFAASIALLGLLEKLRQDRAGLGRPITVKLLLRERHLFAQWGQSEPVKIISLKELPQPELVAELRAVLENSVALVDPEIMLQRNVDMMRHFDESRANAERELELLQQSLKRRQNELLETMRQAETDALTGLLNRRAFDVKLKQVFLHTMRQKDSPFSLLFFDLDYFKEINDEFGHQFGDTYLNKMASVLREIIRENVDFAFRYGGDEFAVVIFADYPHACGKAKQVLDMMEGKVSIGITSVNRNTSDELTLEEFIRRADNALYEAKHRGRGRAVVDVCKSSLDGNCQFPCPENERSEVSSLRPNERSEVSSL